MSNIWREENEKVLERNELVVGRIKEIQNEKNLDAKYVEYFQKAASNILMMEGFRQDMESGKFQKLSLEEHKAYNHKLFGEFEGENYETSYANPEYAVEKLGEMGTVLAYVYYRILNLVGDVVCGRLMTMTFVEELFVQIYTRFEDQDITAEELGKIVSEYFHDYSEIFSEVTVSEMMNPEFDYFTELIKTADLTNLGYLYQFGKHVTDNELQIAQFINDLPEEDVRAMAHTYVQGFLIGYEKMGKDIHKKKTVCVWYALGFERMVRFAMEEFEKEGIHCNVSHGRISTSEASRQAKYDHKDDHALYLDKAYIERYQETLKAAFEKEKTNAAGYAGPAVIQTFGEKEFDPINKEAAAHLDDKQKKLNVKMASSFQEIKSEYINPEERSFTIIAYPIPEIGPKFKEIFAETVKVNTLDYKTYEDIQQRIIDVLDQADTVHVTGRGDNKTDLTIKIAKLEDPSKMTAFENCVADVNIPVGEVFTSPVLTGTNGLLHVTKVYLNGLLFKDLEIELKDGMIVNYNCKNFETEAENKKFVLDNVLFQHDSVPIGEFAIGTNTVAYKMGIEYDCQAQLPILIAEKTGPHFAMGDTCFSRSEDVKTFNPDGKEMVAKENEVSALRNSDPAKAYFNCHTDITIPYDELDMITVIRPDGSKEDIISGGRFVTPGTEELNKPLDSMNK